MDNFQTSLATTLDKSCWNSSGAIVKRLIKSRASIICVYMSYSMDGPGPSIGVSGTHEEFFLSDFGIWMGRKHYSYGCCRPIRMHKVWKTLVLRKNIVEHMSILRHEVAMRQSRVVPGKHGMVALMLVLKEAEVKAEDISVHMHQR